MLIRNQIEGGEKVTSQVMKIAKYASSGRERPR
jgi:hypothetical protein